jgi:hypothetical protein
MTKISELPNTHTYPLRALAELRAKEDELPADRVQNSINWLQSKEGLSFWSDVNQGQQPPIPAASIEDLRRAGMLPEPEPVIQGFERVDTAPPPFYCENSESTAGSCAKQCAECAVDERSAKRKPSITLEDYARMEAEHEAITSPAHYKVCEGLDVVDMIRAVLTPEQFRGYCLGNLIKYRMRAGKKTMSPMEDLGKAHVYETWLKEMEGGDK